MVTASIGVMNAKLITTYLFISLTECMNAYGHNVKCWCVVVCEQKQKAGKQAKITDAERDVVAYLVHVVPRLGRRLHVRHIPAGGTRLTVGQRHLALVDQIALVADEQQRYGFVALHAQDLLTAFIDTSYDTKLLARTYEARNWWLEDGVPKFDRGLKAFIVGDGEHAQESLAAAEVVVADGGVVFLAGRVENVDLDLFAVEHDLQNE